MRNGDWIQTYAGIAFYPLDPRPEEILLIDIAHALALTCRYNGHCQTFYSVAEHCCRMAAADLPGSIKWRLMHDAAEAYLCDLPRPVKYSTPGYRALEDKLLAMIGEVFGLEPFDKKSIEWADMVMMATEKRDIIPGGPQWGLSLPEPLEEKIIPWPWQTAKVRFLEECGRIL